MRANGRASGPVLTSVFFSIFDHSGLIFSSISVVQFGVKSQYFSAEIGIVTFQIANLVGLLLQQLFNVDPVSPRPEITVVLEV